MCRCSFFRCFNNLIPVCFNSLFVVTMSICLQVSHFYLVLKLCNKSLLFLCHCFLLCFQFFLTLFLLFFQLFLICCSLLFKAFPLLFSIVCNFVSCSIIFLQCLCMCSCSGICSINDSFPPFCNRGITISFAVSFQILIFNLVRQFFNKNISKLFSRLSNIF